MDKYSWGNFSKQFSHLSGLVGIYDFTLPEIESTDPIEKSHRSYNDVFNNQSRDLSYMIKIADTTATSTESHLMKYISPIIQNRENVERSMLRIQTNPWRHSCHFDTYDQTVIMLDGVNNGYYLESFSMIPKRKVCQSVMVFTTKLQTLSL